MTSERWAVAVVLATWICSGACTTAVPPEAAPVGGESSSLDRAPSPTPAAPPEPQIAEAAPPVLPPEPIETARETVAAQSAGDVPLIPVAAAAETPPQPVDVLALVDLQRDALMGSWTREGSSLVTPAAMRTALVVPHDAAGLPLERGRRTDGWARESEFLPDGRGATDDGGSGRIRLVHPRLESGRRAFGSTERYDDPGPGVPARRRRRPSSAPSVEPVPAITPSKSFATAIRSWNGRAIPTG
jgi:hypothetical protein